MNAGNWKEGQMLVQSQLLHPDHQGAKAFIGGGRGLAEAAPSALTVILKLVVRGLTGITVIALSAVNLQLLGWLVPASLRPVLRVVAAPYAWLPSWYERCTWWGFRDL